MVVGAVAVFAGVVANAGAGVVVVASVVGVVVAIAGAIAIAAGDVVGVAGAVAVTVGVFVFGVPIASLSYRRPRIACTSLLT